MAATPYRRKSSHRRDLMLDALLFHFKCVIHCFRLMRDVWIRRRLAWPWRASRQAIQTSNRLMRSVIVVSPPCAIGKHFIDWGVKQVIGIVAERLHGNGQDDGEDLVF